MVTRRSLPSRANLSCHIPSLSAIRKKPAHQIDRSSLTFTATLPSNSSRQYLATSEADLSAKQNSVADTPNIRKLMSGGSSNHIESKN